MWQVAVAISCDSPLIRIDRISEPDGARVTFKLEKGIYSKFKEIAEKEGRGISEIMRESLTDWLQNKKHVSMPDFITFIKEQKNVSKSWLEISSLVLEQYGISLDKEQLKSLSR